MFEKATPGFDVLEKELKDLESLGSSFLSLKVFLAKHNLFVTKNDIKMLRTLLKDNRNWKLVKVTDYQLQRRGKKK
jgi:hypothetical protein